MGVLDNNLKNKKRSELLEIIYQDRVENSELEQEVRTLKRNSEEGLDADRILYSARRRVEAEEVREELKKVKKLEYREKYRKTFLSTVGILIVVAAISILVATLFMPVMKIYGSSMSPTLEDGEIVLAIKGNDFDIGDTVAFYYGNKLLIKRVIAGPGDWVDIKDNGDVYVNDQLLEEPYLQEKALGECDLTFPYQVSDERWFLMGDNRSVSIDSRSSQVGCVSEEQIVGKIVFGIWPLNRFGTVNNE